MKRKMSEAEVVGNFSGAVEGGELFLHYQPQYNYSTGIISGAEALVRWDHPEFGMQSPEDFIPVLEKNGLIRRADLFVFDSICRFQKKCIDENIITVPISFNMSLHDLDDHDYVSEIESIRAKYKVPAKCLRAEITGSFAESGVELISSLVKQLHRYGYAAEIDNFGSSFSSLNLLKNIAVDIIKLNVDFLNDDASGRGGTIVNAVVQLTKWLNIPTIAERVETADQADFMNSVGCNYVQGNLYSEPVGGDIFLGMLSNGSQKSLAPSIEDIRKIDTKKFWNMNSPETLIFSIYVGPAAIFSYENGKAEILRVNSKYIKEIGMNMSGKDIFSSSAWDYHDADNRKIYEDTIQKAIRSGYEESCETWRRVNSKCCGEDDICIRSNIRVIGKTGEHYIIYATIQNITAEKKIFEDVYNSDKRFRFAVEQINAYAWEYTIATKQMRPCFRCMRDLGLPPLLENYPDSAIERGIFPQDYADMYRDWHVQLENGVDHLEAIIPLTKDRIPFHVRYTLERDENGRPLKAYGSAALVVDRDILKQ